MKTTGKYILDTEGNPVEVTDLMEWAEWFETSKEKRVVAKTKLKNVTVSTVFLGLDHNWDNLFGHKGKRRGKPLLYETMVFENKITTEDVMGSPLKFYKSLDDYSERYHDKKEAGAGHHEIVKRLIINKI